MLFRSLASNARVNDESELLDYYNRHKSEFLMPAEIKVRRYSSTTQDLLEDIVNGGSTKKNGVDVLDETLNASNLNPQLLDIFLRVPKGSFTPILNSGNGVFIIFMIQDRIGNTQLPFVQVRGIIMQKIISSKQDKILNDHFEKLKSSAKIVMLRTK